MTDTVRGPVAMFDALGFKGVWHRHEPGKVIAKLKRLQPTAAKILARFGDEETLRAGGSMLTRASATLLSDTVVLGLGVRDVAEMQALAARLAPEGAASQKFSQPHFDVLALGFLMRSIGTFLHDAGLDEPVLAYRGAISFGEFTLDDRFVVGPAIDDAAEHMNMASAALVWLTPQAMDVVGQVPSARGFFAAGHENAAVEWPVPLADGCRLKTWAVNPLWERPRSDSGAGWIARLLSSFVGPSARVRVLRQNTEAFLNVAKKRPRAEPPERGAVRVVSEQPLGEPADGAASESSGDE